MAGQSFDRHKDTERVDYWVVAGEGEGGFVPMLLLFL